MGHCPLSPQGTPPPRGWLCELGASVSASVEGVTRVSAPQGCWSGLRALALGTSGRRRAARAVPWGALLPVVLSSSRQVFCGADSLLSLPSHLPGTRPSGPPSIK